MGLLEHVLFPGLWAALFAWQLRQFWLQPGYLILVPTELFFLSVLLSASEYCYASLLHLISYALLPFVAVVYLLGLGLASVRFLLLLPLLIILPLIFLAYYGVYLLVSWLLHFCSFLFSGSSALFSKICIVRSPRFRGKTESGPALHCLDGCSRQLESKLCPTCESMVDGSSLLTGTSWLFTRPIEEHLHHTEYDLKQSTEHCALCYLLIHSKIANKSTTTGFTSQYGSISNLEAAGEKLRIKISERRHISQEPILSIQLVSRAFETMPLVVSQANDVSEYHKCDVSQETTSLVTREWARRQIQTCKDGHGNCGTYYMKNIQRHYRPTRLLDVGNKGDTSVRLILTTDPPMRKLVDQYVALSYCWGNSCKTFLLEQNIEAMKQPTEFGDWDKSYRDAISITRDLGIRYLWIDALCIIQHQESQEDWRKESPNMGLVYANATCVLSATASEDSAGGCVFPRMPFAGGCHLRQQGNMTLDITPSAQQSTIMADLFKSKVESSRLTTRAWTFQERMLASRILHFCDGVVLFECNEMQASSSHGFGQPYPKRTDVSLDGKMQTRVGPEQPPRPSLPLIRMPKFSPPRFSADDLFTWSNEDVWIEPISTRPLSRPARGRGHWENRRVMHWYQWSSFSDFFDFLDFSDLVNIFRDLKSYREYATWKTWRGESFESARMGMRGAFETLLRFKGTILAEQIEFHNCWYQIVRNYSVRNLTKHTDKLAAIEGLAMFVPCPFISGLWENVFPINLLWTSEKPCEVRPDRKIPTWSWASIDGRINNLLHTRGSSTWFSQQSWKDLDLYITRASPKPEPTPGQCVQVVGIAFRIPLFKLDISKMHFIPDIILTGREHDKLLCLPILSFKNTQVSPYVKYRQLHGIVVQETSAASQVYVRIGYFWTMDKDAIQEILDRRPQDAVHSIQIV